MDFSSAEDLDIFEKQKQHLRLLLAAGRERFLYKLQNS